MAKTKCDQCGAKIKKNIKFCPECGQPTERVPLPPEGPVRPLVIGEKSSQRWIKWGASAAVLLLLARGCSWLLTPESEQASQELGVGNSDVIADVVNPDEGPDPEPADSSQGSASGLGDAEKAMAQGSSSGNKSNLSFAIEIEDEIIFYNDFTFSGGGTLRKNKKTEEVTSFLDEVCMTMDYDGEWLYYSHYMDSPGVIKIDLQGQEQVRLAEDEAAFLTVTLDAVYYSDQLLHLHRMDKSGANNTVLADWPVSNFQIMDQQIFYVESDSGIGPFNRMNLDGTGKTNVVPEQISRLSYADGWLYYINVMDGDKVYKIKPDGSEKTQISEGGVDSFVVDGPWLYYTPFSENGFYKLNMETQEIVTFTQSDTVYAFNILSDSIYYVFDSEAGARVGAIKK